MCTRHYIITVVRHSDEALTLTGAVRHVIILDADSKDVTVGMSSPPRDFTQPDVLAAISSVLHPDGQSPSMSLEAVQYNPLVHRHHCSFYSMYLLGIVSKANVL